MYNFETEEPLIPNKNHTFKGPFEKNGEKKRLRSRNSYLESLSDEKKKTRNYHRRRSKQERRKRCKARRIAKPSYYGKPSYFRRYRKPKSNHYLPKKNVVPAKKTTNCITTFTSAYCELYDNCKIDHTTKEQLHKLIDNCVAEIDCCINNPFLQHKSVESMKGKLAADLIVTMFQLLATSKKNKLFVYFIAYLNKIFPKTICKLIHQVPIYGCWKDLLDIVAELGKSKSVKAKALRKACLIEYAKQLREDGKSVAIAVKQSELPFISMAAKWAPREAKSYDKKYKVVDEILTYMFGESAMKEDKHRCRKRYRRLIKKLNTFFKMPEVMQLILNARKVEMVVEKKVNIGDEESKEDTGKMEYADVGKVNTYATVCKLTSYYDFKKVVENEYFDRIRHILQHSKERYLALYTFKIESYNDTSETKADDEVKTEEKYK